MNDLVFVYYNCRSRHKRLLKTTIDKDPILLKSIHPSLEWIMESYNISFRYHNLSSMNLEPRIAPRILGTSYAPKGSTQEDEEEDDDEDKDLSLGNDLGHICSYLLYYKFLWTLKAT
jgi:hypothetical protein